MTDSPRFAKAKRFDLLKWAMIAFLFVVSYLLFYQLTLRPSSDISIHATWAGECSFRDPVSFVRHGAHPMWHALVAVVMLLGVPLTPAAALVTALCKAIEVWLIHRLMTLSLCHRLKPCAITSLSFVCAVVSCLCIPFYNPTVYLGVGTPNTWHSPTQMIAMVFMLLGVPYTARCYDRFEELLPRMGDRTLIPWREAISLGVLLFLSLLAKPTFMQAFLPGACLFFLVKWIQHPRNSRYFLQIIVCVLPSVIFMIFQYMYYFGIIVPWQASMVVQSNLDKLLGTIVRVVLMMAFPIYTLICCRDQKKDTTFWLTLVFTAVAIIEFLILGENGRRAADGNFGWGMMGASLMFWLICLIRFFRQEGVLVRRPSVRYGIGWLLLAWHAISGVYYVIYLFVSGSSL